MKYIFKLILILFFASCSNANYPVKVIYQSANNHKKDSLINFNIFINNITNKKILIKYNIDKLNVGCASLDTLDSIVFYKNNIEKRGLENNFLIENKKGLFRNFFNKKAIIEIFKGQNIINLGFITMHCNETSDIILAPKENFLYKNLHIDYRLLKVLKNDKKIRLLYIYKNEKNKLIIIKSNWIILPK